MHTEKHPLAGKTVKVKLKGPLHTGQSGEVEYQLEDWWDHLMGKFWVEVAGNWAAIHYSMRAGISGLPPDDEVIYGHIDGLGHLVHASELIDETPCDSWIWIDGGNDRASCQELVHGPEKKHFRSGIGEWTDADHERAIKACEEDS